MIVIRLTGIAFAVASYYLHLLAMKAVHEGLYVAPFLIFAIAGFAFLFGIYLLFTSEQEMFNNDTNKEVRKVGKGQE